MRRLNEPSHLDLCYLQKPIIIACGSERVNKLKQELSGNKTYIFSKRPKFSNTSFHIFVLILYFMQSFLEILCGTAKEHSDLGLHG